MADSKEKTLLGLFSGFYGTVDGESNRRLKGCGL